MKNLKAKDIMTEDVLAVEEDMQIDIVAEFLLENCISGAPVVDKESKLVGVVSLTDIARFASLPVLDPRAGVFEDYFRTTSDLRIPKRELAGLRANLDALVPVREIMTREVVRVGEDAPVKVVAETMIDRRVHRLLVTSGERIVGIISSFDLLGLVARVDA